MANVQDNLAQAVETADVSANRQRLLVVTPPARRNVSKEGRPVTSLATVFGRFAEMQHLVGDQVIALEESVEQQGERLAELAAQLPEIMERMNWLIASYYEETRQTQTLREKLARQEAVLATVTEAVRGLCENQADWKQTLDHLTQVLDWAQNRPVRAPKSLEE
jgi:chromosome segregation ATPase